MPGNDITSGETVGNLTALLMRFYRMPASSAEVEPPGAPPERLLAAKDLLDREAAVDGEEGEGTGGCCRLAPLSGEPPPPQGRCKVPNHLLPGLTPGTG